jgi:hypothetical protein
VVEQAIGELVRVLIIERGVKIVVENVRLLEEAKRI